MYCNTSPEVTSMVARLREVFFKKFDDASALEKFVKSKADVAFSPFETRECQDEALYRAAIYAQFFPTVVPIPSQIIYQKPATIVYWDDGTKTVVKCAEDQTFDEYTGFIAALAKKCYGTNTAIKRIISKHKVVITKKAKKKKTAPSTTVADTTVVEEKPSENKERKD